MFAETHAARARRSSREGLVDGLRIDHPDGLADPAGYLERAARRRRRARVGGEDPRPRRAAARLAGRGDGRLRVPRRRRGAVRRPGGRGAADRAVGGAGGDARPFGEWAREAKREQVARAVRARRRVAAAAVARRRRARGGARGAAGVPHLHPRACRRARTSHVLREAGLRVASRSAPRPFVTRFQQTTPPVMAKGVEDTAFYRYVAAARPERRRRRPEPLRSIGVDAFHAGNAQRAARFPRHLLVALDARHEALGRRARAARRARRHGGGVGGARCGAGASCARRCARAARPTRSRSTRSSRRSSAPGRSSRSGCAPTWRRRCASASVTTSWVEPDAAHEERVLGYCRALYEHRPFLDGLRAVRGARSRASGELPRCARPR